MKSKSKKENIIISIIVFSLCILAVIFCFENSKIKEVLIILTSIVAAVAVFIQIKRARELATGEFVLSMQQEYAANEKHTELFIKCWRDLKEKKEESFSEEDDILILNYLTFFESMYIMVINNVLSMEMLDELFGRRFFVVVNSKKIQEKDLKENYKYYLNVFRLHAIWKTYRIRNGKKIFADDKVFYKPNNEKHTKHLRDLQCFLKKIIDDENKDLQDVLEEEANKKTYKEIYKHCPKDKAEWDEWSFVKKMVNRILYEYK